MWFDNPNPHGIPLYYLCVTGTLKESALHVVMNTEVVLKFFIHKFITIVRLKNHGMKELKNGEDHILMF